MARTFTKNLSNNVSLGNAAVGPLLQGCSGITFSSWIFPQTLNESTTAGDDLFFAYHSMGLACFAIACSFSVSGVGDPVLGCRRAQGDTNHAVVAGTTIVTGQWQHIAGCITFGGAGKIFVDGQSISVTVVSGTAATTTAGAFQHTAGTRPDALGAQFGDSGVVSTARQFNGQMAECGLWNIELSSAEIQSLYKGFAPPQVKPQNLTCYWPMIGRGTVIEELRNGKNGTIAGSIPNADHPRTYA